MNYKKHSKLSIIVLLLSILLIVSGCTQTQNLDNKEIKFEIQKNLTQELLFCKTYYDGCNTCSVTNGVKGGCTRRMCSSTSQPHCLSYSSGH